MELRKFTLFGLLITITISSFALADEIFEKEIFKAATEIINVVKINNGQISNVEKFVPERADLIIEHFKRYFLEKDPMMMEASPVLLLYVTYHNSQCFEMEIYFPPHCCELGLTNNVKWRLAVSLGGL